VIFHARGAKRFGYVLFGLALIVSSVAWANGQEFFAASFATKPDLAYVGSVKDTTGHPLVGAQVVVWAVDFGLTFPASTDATGRYRTPDVGANIKEVTTKVDLKQLRIECAFPGYEQVKRATLPDKTEGIVEIDFKMRKVGSADTAGDRPSNHAPRAWTWLVPAALVIIVIGAAARK
jgi:hypothetical protein